MHQPQLQIPQHHAQLLLVPTCPTTPKQLRQALVTQCQSLLGPFKTRPRYSKLITGGLAALPWPPPSIPACPTRHRDRPWSYTLPSPGQHPAPQPGLGCPKPSSLRSPLHDRFRQAQTAHPGLNQDQGSEATAHGGRRCAQGTVAASANSTGDSSAASGK